MRFPSLVKLPKNKRFSFEPRHYDPIKEEIEERTERIRRELQDGSGENSDSKGYTPGKISFERKAQRVPSTSLLQMSIAAIMGILLFGWIFYGNDIFYILIVAIPIYLLFRLRKPGK